MIRMRKTTKLLSVVWMLMVLAVFTTACGSGSGSSDLRNTISVTGYGEASGTPDLVYVQLGVAIVDSDIGQAIYDANTAIERVTEAVVARGVSSEDVQTTYYSVWTETIYDPETGMPTNEIRYHVDITLAVKVKDVQGVGGLISAALDAGANNVHGINFTIDDPTALEDQARVLAMADAQDRARKLTEGLGVQLGSPVAIGEGTGYVAPTYSYGLKGEVGMGGGGVGAGVPSTISPGQTTVGIQVTVVYELLP